jgi:hypothetical protein
VIELESHPGIDGTAIEMIELLDATDQMIFNGFGEGEIMRAQHQFHG